MTGRLSRSFPRVARERAGVLPLRGEAERGRRRHRQDLVASCRGVDVRELDAEAIEQREVGAELDFARRLRLELRVTGLARASSPWREQLYVSYCASNCGELPAVPSRGAEAEVVMCGTCQNGSSDTRHTPETRPNGAQRLPAPNSELPS